MTNIGRAARDWQLLALVAVLVGCGRTTGASVSPAAAVSPSAARATASPSIAATSSPAGATVPPPLTFLPAVSTKPLDSTTASALQKVLDDLVSGGAPDAIGAVITANGQWSGAAGVDGPAGRAAQPGDEFNIASVSKPILAALVLRLAQDGKVDLDAPLATYLGDLPVDANKATVRQALAMRSGIGDTANDIQVEARADCSHAWTRTEVLRSIPAPHATAGSTWEYSNPTYKLLGYAVEHVTGRTLETQFRDQLFKPLGLDRILLQGATQPAPKPWALPIAGHESGLALEKYGTGGTLPCVSVSTFSFATSAVASDTSSLARWGWGLFTGTLLDQTGLTTMTSGDPDGNPLGMELIANLPSDVAFGVHGSQVGYSAFLLILPVRQEVAVMFINDDQADVQVGAGKLIRALRS